MIMADVAEEQAHWWPPATANPLGVQYAHAICVADAVVHAVLQGKPLLFQSNWSGKTGVSAPQMNATPEWARSVNVDLAAMRPYAQAAYAAGDDDIASLTGNDLKREQYLSETGLGVHTVDWILSALVIAHMNNMAGEISCLKGLQGAKGYPF